MNGNAESRDGLSRWLVANLKIGETYTLADMAGLLGVQTEAVKRKGVLTRQGADAQLLLITREKDKYSTPEYVDHLEGATLFWSGQNRLKSTERNLQNGDHDTFIFIQERRHTPYIYYGRAVPVRMHISMELDNPSRIVFDLPEYYEIIKDVVGQTRENGITTVADPQVPYSPDTPSRTETQIVAKIRTAQTTYRNNVLSFWNNECAVTGVNDTKWLIASHIKPWREATNQERVDPRNSLLLTPNFDKLFDRGVISFSSSDGKIILPDKLSMSMWSNLNRLNINEETQLRTVPDGVGEYLDYHKRYVYNFEPTGTEKMSNEELLENLLVSGLA